MQRGMQRWIGTVMLGLSVTLVLAGCGNPAGVDGELTDEWGAIPQPAVFVPAAGVCHPKFEPIGYLRTYQPVDCAQQHTTETLYLGTVTGAEAGRDEPPGPGSPGLRALRADCEKRSNEYLGADWRTGRIGLAVVLPSPYGWRGGARWYRCDVNEVESIDNGSPVQRDGSLRGALEAPSNLAHGCFSPKVAKGAVSEMTAVACGAKHRSEFAGIWTGPDVGFAAFTKDTGRVHRGCRGVVASYAKIPNDGDIEFRVGTIYYHPNEEEWREGNRGVQCFLWVDDRDLTRSMKGAGVRALPVRVG